MNKEKSMSHFQDHSLNMRSKLAFEWLPEHMEKLLDAGCSYGYSTVHYSKKSNNTWGIDLNPIHIDIAKSKYPAINFSLSSVDNTRFEDQQFDAIVFTDVLEHTNDKIASLDELYRILSPGGVLILSTPQKALFGLFDPYNYGYLLRKYLPFLYKPAYKLVRFLKEGKFPRDYNEVHLEKHFHYSLNDHKQMLNESSFKDKYEIEKVFRSGLFLELLAINLEVILGIVLKGKALDTVLKPFQKLGELDYKIPYGCLAFNIALKIKKKV